MDNLLQDIEHIRFENENTSHQYFVPEDALLDIITESAVSLCLASLDVPLHERPALLHSILNGAQKCLSILLLVQKGGAITGFFRHDSMQRSTPDERLPYAKETLAQIFGVDIGHTSVKRFYETQWDFVIPTLQQNLIFRELHPRVRLPYIEKTVVGAGASGSAFLIRLHPSCHRLPVDDNKVVLKRLEYGEDEKLSDFKKELANLSLLAYLKHPNIVQLHCSYIQGEYCNLVFDAAEGGSLLNYLNGDSNIPRLGIDATLVAIAGLASAIHALHEFTAKALDLKMAGCHHDLAPRNILIRGGTFLLADFGLSTFKGLDEDSFTLFKETRGSYLAPECQIVSENGDLPRGTVNRASDIWSFGCIISEILTYMLRGPNGVKDFHKARLVQVNVETSWYRFHLGPGKMHPRIEDWLDGLRVGPPYAARLVALIRWMLSMDSQRRPDSGEVLMTLNVISILGFAGQVQEVWDNLCTNHSSADYTLEKIRFECWLVSVHRLFEQIGEKGLRDFHLDHAEMVNTLKVERDMLEAANVETDFSQHHWLLVIREHTTRLIKALPTAYGSIFRDLFINRVLQNYDAISLEYTTSAMQSTLEEEIGVLVAVKHITALAEQGRLVDNSDLAIDHRDIRITKEIGIHSLGNLESSDQPILIEWLKYNEVWVDESIGKELQERLTSIAGLLHHESMARIPSTLRCKGISQDASRRSFAFVYERPSGNLEPITLYHLLRTKDPQTNERLYRPLFELRFKLAYDLCQFICTFHEIGWLHRNLHSMNVVFFPESGVDNDKVASEPRIMGLGASREGSIDAFTQGHDGFGELRSYQHPNYLDGRRYREEYDYYSIGMLLLEIGMWSTLSEISKSKRFQGKTGKEFTKEILDQRVSKLGITMGSDYMNSVRWCLEQGWAEVMPVDRDRPTPSEESPYFGFQRQVVDRLRLYQPQERPRAIGI